MPIIIPQLVNDLRFILNLVETGGASTNLTNASLSLAALIKNLEAGTPEPAHAVANEQTALTRRVAQLEEENRQLILVNQDLHSCHQRLDKLAQESSVKDEHIAEIHRIAETQAHSIEKLQARLHRAQNKIQAIAATIASDE